MVKQEYLERQLEFDFMNDNKKLGCYERKNKMQFGISDLIEVTIWTSIGLAGGYYLGKFMGGDKEVIVALCGAYTGLVDFGFKISR